MKDEQDNSKEVFNSIVTYWESQHEITSQDRAKAQDQIAAMIEQTKKEIQNER